MTMENGPTLSDPVSDIEMRLSLARMEKEVNDLRVAVMLAARQVDIARKIIEDGQIAKAAADEKLALADRQLSAAEVVLRKYLADRIRLRNLPPELAKLAADTPEAP
jgi:hypothetical protein